MILGFNQLPPSYNALLRMHWAVRRDHKYHWRMLIREQFEGLPREPIKQCKIRFTLYVRRRRDHDNAPAQFKIIGDALKELGIIKNDSPRCVTELETKQVLVGRNGIEHCDVEIIETAPFVAANASVSMAAIRQARQGLKR